MPDLNDIEEFKSLINTLGNEPEILASRGQEIEDVQPDETGVPDDISRLFADAASEPEPETGPEEAVELDSEPDDGFDMGSDLDVLPDFAQADEDYSTENAEGDDFFNPGTGGEDDVSPVEEEPSGDESEGELSYDEVPAEDFTSEDDFSFDDIAAISEPVEDLQEPAGTEEFSIEEPGADDFSFEEPSADEFSIEESSGDEFSLDEPETGEFSIDDPSAEDFSFGELGNDEEFSLDEPAGEDSGVDEFMSALDEIPDEVPENSEIEEPDSLESEETDTEFDIGGLDTPAEMEISEDDDFSFSDLGLPEEPSEDGVDEFDTGFDMSPEEGGGDDEDFGFGDFAVPETTDESSEEADESFGTDDFEGEELLSVDEEGDLDNFDVSDFNLGDLGEQFGIDSEDTGEMELGPVPAFSVGDAAEMEEVSSAGDEDISLSDEEFERLQITMESLPRNLKLVIEEQIGEKGLSGDSLTKVVDALVKGNSPKQIAGIVGKIIGSRIEIPAQYEKLSGQIFEEERNTFGYAFRHNILPLLRAFLAGAAILGLLAFLIFRFVYTPLYANMLYRSGVREIQADQYSAGNEYFNRAVDKWRVKKWYFTYAEEFAAEKQYPLAEGKYEELLDYYTNDSQGLVDYARLESETLGKYSKAEELLKRRLEQDAYDEETLLLRGDNFIRWGDELDPDKYDEARYHYALLIQRWGQKDPYLFRMLRYLMRVDNYPEVMRIKNAFESNSRAKIEPEIYAELAGYMMDKGNYDEVSPILERTREIAPNMPEVYYQYGRYFRFINDDFREETAVQTTLELMGGENPPTRKKLKMLIKSHNRYGEILYDKGAYLDSEKEFQSARNRYEDGLNAGRLTPESDFGLIYANIGDLYYYVAGDFDTALKQYTMSEENLYSTPDLSYKKGYIHFRSTDYQKALMEFYSSADGYSDDPNLLYATAGTLYMRNDFFSAQGYYEHLVDILEGEKEKIDYFLLDEKQEHRALIENLMIAYNNLGVTLNRLYEATGDPEKNSRSLVNLTRSSEYHDFLSRDTETLSRSETMNLSFINSKTLMYPMEDYELQIFMDLPKDREDLFFR